MAISKIKKASISEEVYNQIIENIAEKEWLPCSKIPSEVELAELLGVSRISVRNAIQRLVGQGILESRHGEGTFVSDLSIARMFENMVPLLNVQKEKIIELYEFRRIMETGNIRLLSDQKNVEVLVANLLENYQKMQECTEDIEAFVRKDIEFHCLLASHTNNSIIKAMYDTVRESLYPNQLLVQKMFGTKGALKYHKMIIDDLAEKDFEKAEADMNEHMRMTILNIRTSKQNIE